MEYLVKYILILALIIADIGILVVIKEFIEDGDPKEIILIGVVLFLILLAGIISGINTPVYRFR